MKGAREELETGASPLFRKLISIVFVFLRYIVPLIVIFVIWNRAINVWGIFQSTCLGS